MAIELSEDSDRGSLFPLKDPAFYTQPPADDEVVNNLLDALRATLLSPNPQIATLARTTLKRVRQIQGAAALSEIIERIAWAFHVSVEDLASDKRTQHLALYRQIAFYICRTISGASYPAIGKSFNRNHSTVLHGYRAIQRRMQRDSGFHLSIHQLEGRVADIPKLAEAAA